jgi:hypothetical protein
MGRNYITKKLLIVIYSKSFTNANGLRSNAQANFASMCVYTLPLLFEWVSQDSAIEMWGVVKLLHRWIEVSVESLVEDSVICDDFLDLIDLRWFVLTSGWYSCFAFLDWWCCNNINLLQPYIRLTHAYRMICLFPWLVAIGSWHGLLVSQVDFGLSGSKMDEKTRMLSFAQVAYWTYGDPLAWWVGFFFIISNVEIGQMSIVPL